MSTKRLRRLCAVRAKTFTHLRAGAKCVRCGKPAVAIVDAWDTGKPVCKDDGEWAEKAGRIVNYEPEVWK
jgi:hypothetical protein